MHILGIGVDSKGRVWLMPKVDKTAFFDPHSGAWKAFPNMEAAFEEMKDDAPRFNGERPEFATPDYSPDGKRVAWRMLSWQLVYFDGTAWHRWKRADIEPGANASHFTFGSPFFDKNDRLCVNIDNNTWKLNDDQSWAKDAMEVMFPDESSNGLPIPPKAKAPDYAITNSPDSVAADNKGVFWLTWQHKLYECSNGKCVEVFSWTNMIHLPVGGKSSPRGRTSMAMFF